MCNSRRISFSDKSHTRRCTMPKSEDKWFSCAVLRLRSDFHFVCIYIILFSIVFLSLALPSFAGLVVMQSKSTHRLLTKSSILMFPNELHNQTEINDVAFQSRHAQHQQRGRKIQRTQQQQYEWNYSGLAAGVSGLNAPAAGRRICFSSIRFTSCAFASPSLSNDRIKYI